MKYHIGPLKYVERNKNELNSKAFEGARIGLIWVDIFFASAT
jgi:hypothetical protein